MARRSNKRETKRKTRKEAASNAIPAPSTASPDREDWEAKDALRTLHRASEITGNKGLMKRVKTHAKAEAERSARVARLEGKLI